MLTKHSGGTIVYRSKPTESYDTATGSGTSGTSGTATVGTGSSSGTSEPVTTTATGDVSQTTDTTTATTDTLQASTANKGGKPAVNPGQGYYNRSEQATTSSNNLYVNPNLDTLREELGIVEGGTIEEGSDTIMGPYPIVDYVEPEQAVTIGRAEETIYYFHPDHLGSTAYVTDEKGDLAEHLEYFPFGETWVQEGGKKASNYLYTSKEYDAETGLYYYGARYYDPRTSVWVSPDPILDSYLDGEPKGGIYDSRNNSLFTYGYNNPIRYYDPNGMLTEDGIMESGDTLSQIAKDNNTSVKELMAINQNNPSIKNKDMIMEGGKLNLPNNFSTKGHSFGMEFAFGLAIKLEGGTVQDQKGNINQYDSISFGLATGFTANGFLNKQLLTATHADQIDGWGTDVGKSVGPTQTGASTGKGYGGVSYGGNIGVSTPGLSTYYLSFTKTNKRRHVNDRYKTIMTRRGSRKKLIESAR